MNLEKYQIYVNDLYSRSEDPKDDELRIFLGLLAELGRVSEIVGRGYKDGIDNIEGWREAMEDKVGDTLFYLAHLCNFYDMDLNSIIETNVLQKYAQKEAED